jgi:hypothetical protein
MCFKIGKPAAETYMLREVYDDDASSQMSTYEWFIRLKVEERQRMTKIGVANLQLRDPNL